MKKNFNIGENIGFGLDRVINNFWFFISVFMFVFALLISSSYLDTSSLPCLSAFALDMLFFIIVFLLFFVISIGLHKIALILTTKEKAGTKDTNDLLPVFPKFILTMIMYKAIVFLGFIFFIIPGIIFIIKYQFAPFIVLNEKNVSIREAFKKSSLLASSLQWKLFFFELITTFINFFGFMCFGIGLAITLPVTIIARAKIYKELKKVNGKSNTK